MKTKTGISYKRSRIRKSAGKPEQMWAKLPAPDGPASSESMVLKEMTVAYGLKQETVSRMSGFSLRAIAHWVAGKAPGEAGRIRLTELQRLLAALSAIVEPVALEDWLQKPNPAFQGSTPLQVVERGEMDRLWRMLYELGSGEPG